MSMRTVKEPVSVRAGKLYAAYCGRLPRSTHAMMIYGAALSLLFSGLIAVYNISAGPLSNLNDIGGWDNRLLFIAMTAAVQVLLLLLTTALSGKSYLRIALRQAIVTAGFVIQLLAINQKTHAFVEQLLPLIRQMDVHGLSAIAQMETNLSSPALTLIYLVTRGPIYDMYMVKLLCAAAFCVLCLMAMHAADRNGMGIRSEVLLALCLILPQGFMSAACAAQIDVLAVTLTAAALALCLREKPLAWAGTICYGAAIAVSGAALYALPVFVMLMLRGRMKGVQLALCAAIPVVLCLPAVLAGQNILAALASLVRVVFGVPDFAAGAPNLMNFFPRAAMEEMPEYFMLGKMSNVDPFTNFSPYYTLESFAMIMHGMALAGFALYAMAFAFVQRRGMEKTAGAFALALAAGIACPGATAGAWLLVSVIALYAIVSAPRLRIPACAVLFAAMCSAAYPVTAEIMLPMEVALIICLLALFDLLGMFDANRKEDAAHE
ncbi:MAG: hypothetical protein IKB82_02975 [Clostridia bacterium]|nr:hypothetical protein [Clostridia bacterium]